jgi:hypothetical protein
MSNAWGKLAKNLSTLSWSVVDGRPQKATFPTITNLQAVQNLLHMHRYTSFYTHTFPQIFFTNYRRYLYRFTHSPHPLLLSLLFIN